MSYHSNAAALTRAITRAVDVGLTRAGAVVADAVRDNLRGGYTTGNFVTGANLNSVYVTPVTTLGGDRTIAITTRLTDPNYPLFWEEGHENRFTRRYERVPKWAPALEATADEATALVVRAVQDAAREAGATLLVSVRSSVRTGTGSAG